MATTDYMRIYQENEPLKTILLIYTIEFFIKFASLLHIILQIIVYQ